MFNANTNVDATFRAQVYSNTKIKQVKDLP